MGVPSQRKHRSGAWWQTVENASLSAGTNGEAATAASASAAPARTAAWNTAGESASAVRH